MTRLLLAARLFPAVFCVAVLCIGCAHVEKSDEVSLYFSSRRIANDKERSRVAQVLTNINEQREKEKKNVAWLNDIYKSFRIRKVNDIPKQEYARYRNFLDFDGTAVYILVHPAFYPFFMSDMRLSSEDDLLTPPSKNIVERFYGHSSHVVHGLNVDVMQAQEKAFRDFVEGMSTEKKLIVFILPGNHRSHLSYGYLEGRDEYVRYINEISNISESVVYMESRDYDDGSLHESDFAVLTEFLAGIQARYILLGGGYFGRCLERFYTQLSNAIDFDRISVVPEITATSSEDIGGAASDSLLTKEGKMNFSKAKSALRYDASGNEKGALPSMRSLYVYELRNSRLVLISRPR